MGNVQVTWKLGLEEAKLVEESLKERYDLLAKHAKLKPETPEMEELQKGSRHKAGIIEDILRKV